MKDMKGMKGMTCMGGYCSNCRGGSLLVMGLLILANAYWSFVQDWYVFFGGLLAIGGLLKMIMPNCPHC